MILNEQIHYSVAGMADAMDKIRQFALANGWTVDYWETSSAWDTVTPYGWKAGTETNLQLYSPGYGNQNMCYRMRTLVNDLDPAEIWFYNYGVYPGYRNHNLEWIHPISQNTFYQTGTYSNRASMPISTFDSMYIYGNDKFISVVFKLTSMSSVTVNFGTWDLFKSWENYADGLFHCTPTGFSHVSGNAYQWYKIDENPGSWYLPLAATTNAIIFEGVKDLFYSNYTPTPVVSIGAESGQFNNMKDFLWFNTFTDKRIAFHPTMFVKDPIGETFYPAGLSPIAYVNGTNLTFGEQITFGTDTYKCYPGINIPNPIWVAYRIA